MDIMFGKKITKNHVSDFDVFFRAFDKGRKDLTPSRIQEVEKHKKIADKRDHPVEADDKILWEKF